jgi:NTP pyrophosphatase (non-canonical NTP hydrolase)
MTAARDLTFRRVTEVNSARCERWHPGYPHGDRNWSGADWANALAGEVGEACNVVKKLRRIDIGAPGLTDPPSDELRAALADECADVFLYLDLLATFYSIDLPAAIVRKFNVVSERQQFPERLP